MASPVMQSQTMSRQSDLSNVDFTHFVKFCVVLSNTSIWGWWSHSFHAFMLHFLAIPPQKKICGALLFAQVLKSFVSYFTRKWVGNSLMQNGWLCETLESWTFSSFSTFSDVRQVKHFWLTSFKSCIRPGT